MILNCFAVIPQLIEKCNAIINGKKDNYRRGGFNNSKSTNSGHLENEEGHDISSNEDSESSESEFDLEDDPQCAKQASFYFISIHDLKNKRFVICSTGCIPHKEGVCCYPPDKQLSEVHLGSHGGSLFKKVFDVAQDDG